jgi:hypothetical protein
MWYCNLTASDLYPDKSFLARVNEIQPFECFYLQITKKPYSKHHVYSFQETPIEGFPGIGPPLTGFCETLADMCEKSSAADNDEAERRLVSRGTPKTLYLYGGAAPVRVLSMLPRPETHDVFIINPRKVQSKPPALP